jgi:hypothetical protein
LTPRAATGSAEPLEESGDRRRRVDLDHTIKVTDVDPQLERTCGDDNAVASLSERLLCLATLLDPERAVGNEGADAVRAKLLAQLLYLAPTVTEDEALLPAVQPRNDHGRVL